MSKALIKSNEIQYKICTIRGIQVMLDRDLAILFQVETKALNRAVKRNKERFPERFCFQINSEEWDTLRFQFGTSKNIENLRFQNGTSSSKHGGRRYLPYVFTEQGVAMLASVLHSSEAVKVSIQIMDAFIAMRRFIASNARIFQRLDSIEQKQLESNQKFKQIFDALEEKQIVPSKGVFFDGQVFDAHLLISRIIRKAKKSIVLIDNYIDESVLQLLTKRKKNIPVTIYTRSISKQLKLDITKYNKQYPTVAVQTLKISHDRFLIIDENILYHFGASLKDLGKKWFAFSRMDIGAVKMLENLGKVKMV